jgi:GNAT superfamily N-acetyltransferase
MTRDGKDPGVVVRPMRRRDVPGFVELRRHVWVDDIETAESYAWLLDHELSAAEAHRWVAIAHGRVVGSAVAALAMWSASRVAQCHVAVETGMRGRGIGRRLYAEAERHVAQLGPTQTMTGTERGDGPSARFASHRGFRHSRDDQAWSLDPRTVSMAELPARLAAAEAEGLRLVPIRALLDRAQDLHRLNIALEGDLPSDVPIAEPYEQWRRSALETPLFSPDASFCVLAGDEPVSMTWIFVDGAGRARHGMTGTLPAYRHRGLARLVKLSSIGWLAEHGVTVLLTDNDAENRDMLALNEQLGYRPLTVFEIWTRDETSGPAAGAR